MTDGPLQLLITNARVATGDPVRYNIGILGGVIVSMTSAEVSVPAARVVDAAGRWVIPGAIDTHAHINQIAPEYSHLPGFGHHDNFAVETRSAVAGGCTTALNYVHWSDELVPAYRCALADATAQSRMNILFHGFVLKMAHVAEIPQAVAEGITTFKMFMPYRGEEARNLGGIGSLNHAQMREAFAAIVAAGAQALVHAEDGDIVDACMQAESDKGLVDLAGWDRSRPAIAEGDAAWTAMYLAEKAGCDVTIVHVSSLEAMRARDALGSAGAALESCPHYMLLNTGSPIGAGGAEGKVAPPIRDAELAGRITEAVLDGRIDFFGTDHNVWPAAAKREWETSKPGLPGIHLFLPLLLTHLVDRHGMAMERAIELTSRNAAVRFGLPSKGKVAVGMDADLVVLEHGERVIHAAEMFSAVDFSPYEGMTLTSWPRTTIVGGTVVFDDGEFPGDEHRGEMLNLRFAAPTPASAGA
jgi:dihydroorotase-like cyclic amidohydrolase